MTLLEALLSTLNPFSIAAIAWCAVWGGYLFIDWQIAEWRKRNG